MAGFRRSQMARCERVLALALFLSLWREHRAFMTPRLARRGLTLGAGPLEEDVGPSDAASEEAKVPLDALSSAEVEDAASWSASLPPLGLSMDLEEVRELRQTIAARHRELLDANAKSEFGKAAELQRELDILRDKDPSAVLDRDIANALFTGDLASVAALRESKSRLQRLCPLPIVRTNRLLLLTENGKNLLTLEPGGKKMRSFSKRLDATPLTALPRRDTARQFQQPTWSHSGDRIAFVSLIVGVKGTEKAQLVIMEEQTMKVVQAMPIDFMIIYMQWSPDDSYITFLSTNRDGRVKLHYMEVRQEAQKQIRSKVLDAGTPLFYSFAGSDPDEASLVIHNAEKKTIYRYEGSLGTQPPLLIPKEPAIPDGPPPVEPVPLSNGPGGFMAPRGWASAGPEGEETRWGAVVVENGYLTTVDVSGRYRRRLVPVRGISSFVISPDQRYIALLQSHPSTGHYSLSVIDVGPFGCGLDPRASPLPKITQKELEIDTLCKGMFFSPDSEKLLLFALPYPRSDVSVAANAWKSNATVKCRWLLYDLAAEPSSTAPNPITFAKFTPRPYFIRLYLPFFDQYAQSFTPWAPDSKSFVYVAQEGVFVQPLPTPMPGRAGSPAAAEAAPATALEAVAEPQAVIGADEGEATGQDAAEEGEADALMVPSMAQLQEALDAARARAAVPGADPNPKAIKLGKGVEVAVWSWN